MRLVVRDNLEHGGLQIQQRSSYVHQTIGALRFPWRADWLRTFWESSIPAVLLRGYEMTNKAGVHDQAIFQKLKGGEDSGPGRAGGDVTSQEKGSEGGTSGGGGSRGS